MSLTVVYLAVPLLTLVWAQWAETAHHLTWRDTVLAFLLAGAPLMLWEPGFLFFVPLFASSGLFLSALRRKDAARVSIAAVSPAAALGIGLAIVSMMLGGAASDSLIGLALRVQWAGSLVGLGLSLSGREELGARIGLAATLFYLSVFWALLLPALLLIRLAACDGPLVL